MQKIIDFFKRVFAPKTLLHGAYTAALTVLIPSVYQMVSNGSMPTLPALVITLKASALTGLGYMLKNGFKGSANITEPEKDENNNLVNKTNQ